MNKYVLGIDFGTLSARALIAEIGTGRELATVARDYPHAVMTENLPPDWALQHPSDYLDCMRESVRAAVAQSGIDKNDIVGIGIDFTASTVLPIDAQGEPLCLKAEFADNPHAWVKLWKHHAAQDYARHMEETAKARNEAFLSRYGGKISSEWMIPKIYETLDKAPEIYLAADRFIDAGDWIVLKLTGNEMRSSSIAGYKALWSKSEGFVSNEYLKAVDARLENVIDEKLSRRLYPVGTKAGELNAFGAELLGLNEGIAVAVANIDAHVALPPAGLTEPGSLMMIMGTSTCHIMIGESAREIPGICGCVEDGVTEGTIGYEAGQSCCGDHFKWMVENCVPASYQKEADARGINIQSLLTEKAQGLKVGQSGLVALDWWNGNRSILVDADLTGLIIGMTLSTKPEEIYRALIEATAFGTRVIIENFVSNGMNIDGLVACGGISKKNKMMMQIYADVLKREIRIARSSQNPALGSAMFGAVAAGVYPGIKEAAIEMGGTDETVYKPVAENSAVYDELYREYKLLHDWFGTGGNDVMKRLKRIRSGKR